MWRSLISRYLTWKFRQKPPWSQRAHGAFVRFGGLDRGLEGQALIRRQRPFAHLEIGRGRDVDPADRPVSGQPVGGRDRGDGWVRLDRAEEPVDPAVGAPAVLVGVRPGPELLAVVAHEAEPVAGRRGVRLEVADDVLDPPERDPVAQLPVRPEDGQEAALVLGGVRPPQRVVVERGRPEVGVVEDRPAVAGVDDRGRQVRLPDPLGQPGAGRPTPADPLDLVGHPAQLVDPVPLRERGQDRLEVAAAQELDLVAPDEAARRSRNSGRSDRIQSSRGPV